MGQQHQVEIGVIGAGHLGRYHIECLSRIEGFSLVGFYDVDQARAEEISAKYNLTAFESPEALMDRVAALCIVTPTVAHFDMAVYGDWSQANTSSLKNH